MYDPDAINTFANLLVFTSVVPALGYTLTYGLGSPWYRSLLGVVMFLLGASLTGVLGVVIARRLFGEYPGYEWVALGVYSLTTLVMWGLWLIVVIERRRGGPAVSFTIGKDTTVTKKDTPTEKVGGVQGIWYKAQRVIRTVVQATVSAAVTIAGAIIALAAFAPDVLNALVEVLPESWLAWLGGAVAFLVALSGALSRIMAIPAINAWLTKLGLGSVPRSAIDD